MIRCKLYLIEKNGKWHGVLTTPEGSMRLYGTKSSICNAAISIARENYNLTVHKIMLEG